MSPSQQGVVDSKEHVNKEDNEKKEEDVVMKYTVEEEGEKDPLQTNDPWKEKAERKEFQEVTLETQDNEDENKPKVTRMSLIHI